ARAWARSDMQTVNRVKAILPKSSKEIFDYEMATRAQVTDEQHATACATLVQKLEQLVFEKVISGYDLNRDAKSAHKDAA
ncbi:MAG TPA: hypothetical protein PKC28_11515, partial [Bdellovibrionales bacterium]|nr:hypothetical protein [Bdellovibrionales bacterium]